MGYETLKRVRAYERVTQEELAKILGMSVVTYNRKENKRGGDFSISEAKLIAKHLNRSLDELFSE